MPVLLSIVPVFVSSPKYKVNTTGKQCWKSMKAARGIAGRKMNGFIL